VRFIPYNTTMRKVKANTKMPYDITGKMIENSVRIFEKKLTKPQYKAVKTTIRWIRKKSTSILSHLYDGEYGSQKQAEKISYHLWNIDIREIVSDKALRIAKMKIEESESKVTISYDESDIYKPNAKKMPWLTRIRDWDTWLTWNGYIFRWVNVWWISILSIVDEEIKTKKKWEKTIECLKWTREKLWRQQWIYVIDRGWDCGSIYRWFDNNKEEYVIRARKNRVLVDIKWKKKKITKFKNWKHKVKLSTGEEMNLHVIQRKWYKTKLYLFTNSEEDSINITKYYFNRWNIEKDFNKMKQLWLEDVRLLSMIKIKNILAIIQFIIVLGQDIYEKVVEKVTILYEHIGLHYKKYCKRRGLWSNPSSFLKFVSYNLWEYMSYKTTPIPTNTLFGGKRELKKLGVI